MTKSLLRRHTGYPHPLLSLLTTLASKPPVASITPPHQPLGDKHLPTTVIRILNNCVRTA